jgi:hypothetical protein
MYINWPLIPGITVILDDYNNSRTETDNWPPYRDTSGDWPLAPEPWPDPPVRHGYINVPPLGGWICPKCEYVYAPNVSECAKCNRDTDDKKRLAKYEMEEL